VDPSASCTDCIPLAIGARSAAISERNSKLDRVNWENQSGGSTINCQFEFEFFQRIARKTNATSQFDSPAATTPANHITALAPKGTKSLILKNFRFLSQNSIHDDPAHCRKAFTRDCRNQTTGEPKGKVVTWLVLKLPNGNASKQLYSSRCESVSGPASMRA
jgi:hypothetical protein